uniref:Uncharacterized protein n=1 Tax=Amphimedon queenslandica TaxID=400682 RepID=A0A1X7VCG0_AMPQE
MPMLRMYCNRIYSCKAILAAMALSVLFVSVIVRMMVTIEPGFDITFSMPTLVLPEISPKYDHWEPVTPSQVCCLSIWLSMTYLSCSLIWEITRFTGFFRIIFAAFHDFRQNIALLSLHSYEIWMFAFIYKTYVTEFDYIFQIIIILPLITLLLLTIFQMTWAQDVAPDDEERLKDLQYYAITSLLYSATMAFHVVCMGFTNFIRSKDEVLGDGDLTDMHIFLLGVAEILYRLHFIYQNYSLIDMYRNPPTPPGERAVDDGRDGQPVVARMPAPDEFTYQAAIMVVGLTIFDAIVIGGNF